MQTEEYRKFLRMLYGTTHDKRRLKKLLLNRLLRGMHLNIGHRIMLKQLMEEKINENGGLY